MNTKESDALEAQVRAEPGNLSLRLKWVVMKTRWAEGEARTSLADWAVGELRALSDRPDFRGRERASCLFWTGEFLRRLEDWEEASVSYLEWWRTGIELPEYWDANWPSLESAAEAFEKAGRLPDARRALGAWVAIATAAPEEEGWLQGLPEVMERLGRLL